MNLTTLLVDYWPYYRLFTASLLIEAPFAGKAIRSFQLEFR